MEKIKKYSFLYPVLISAVSIFTIIYAFFNYVISNNSENAIYNLTILTIFSLTLISSFHSVTYFLREKRLFYEDYIFSIVGSLGTVFNFIFLALAFLNSEENGVFLQEKATAIIIIISCSSCIFLSTLFEPKESLSRFSRLLKFSIVVAGAISCVQIKWLILDSFVEVLSLIIFIILNIALIFIMTAISILCKKEPISKPALRTPYKIYTIITVLSITSTLLFAFWCVVNKKFDDLLVPLSYISAILVAGNKSIHSYFGKDKTRIRKALSFSLIIIGSIFVLIDYLLNPSHPVFRLNVPYLCFAFVCSLSWFSFLQEQKPEKEGFNEKLVKSTYIVLGIFSLTIIPSLSHYSIYYLFLTLLLIAMLTTINVLRINREINTKSK